MTCIIGIVKEGNVWMGADRMISLGNTKSISQEPKIVKKGDILMGFSGSLRGSNALKYQFKPPIIPEACSSMEYMVAKFVPQIRQLLKDEGISKIDSNEETSDNSFLVALKRDNSLFSVGSSYAVAQAAKTAGVGVGWKIAMGALHALEGQGKTPEEMITAALQAAVDLCAFVSPPFDIMSFAEKI